jgi:hypothetical protein
MALERGSVGKSRNVAPLPTGFKYAARADLDDFEMSGKVLAAMNKRLGELEVYHRRPSDLDLRSV